MNVENVLLPGPIHRLREALLIRFDWTAKYNQIVSREIVLHRMKAVNRRTAKQLLINSKLNSASGRDTYSRLSMSSTNIKWLNRYLNCRILQLNASNLYENVYHVNRIISLMISRDSGSVRDLLKDALVVMDIALA